MTEIERVGIVGRTRAAADIAFLLAASGRSVVVVDTGGDRHGGGYKIVDFVSSQSLALGTSATELDSLLNRISETTEMDQLDGSDLVIDCSDDEIAAKKASVAEVASIVRADVPITINSAAYSITEIASELPTSDRVAGLHFFANPELTQTVEVVRGLATKTEVVGQLVALVNTLTDKIAIVVDDRPGFLLNALLVPYLNDVIQAFDDGLATPEDIDIALKLGLGYKRGPLEMLDAIGLDLHLQRTEAIHAATSDARYAPPPLLRRMVVARQVGSSGGAGFRTT